MKRFKAPIGLAGALLGAMLAAGCQSNSTSSPSNPSTMPSKPTTLPATGGQKAAAPFDQQQARYAAEAPPPPVKPPMPIAPPEQPPVQPVKPPMPDRPQLPDNPVSRDRDKLLEQNRELQKKLDDRVALFDKDHPQVKHIVVCWLKKPGDKDGRKLMLDSREVIKNIPGVVNVSGGECLKSDRSVVDSTYDVALVITFKDEAAMKAYATHPAHQKLIEEVLKPNVEKYVVYDYAEK
jgi:hypothetical protein